MNIRRGRAWRGVARYGGAKQGFFLITLIKDINQVRPGKAWLGQVGRGKARFFIY